MNGEIRTPCTENWKQMRVCGSGRFCAVCSLTVLDAQKFNEEELRTLAGGGTKKICVRISPTRVKTGSKRVRLISRIEHYFLQKNLTKLAAVLTAVLLFASCCRQRIMGGWADCTIQNDRLHPQHEYPVGKMGKKEHVTDSSVEKDEETEIEKN